MTDNERYDEIRSELPSAGDELEVLVVARSRTRTQAMLVRDASLKLEIATKNPYRRDPWVMPVDALLQLLVSTGTLERTGYDLSYDAARQALHDWIDEGETK